MDRGGGVIGNGSNDDGDNRDDDDDDGDDVFVKQAMCFAACASRLGHVIILTHF